MSQNLSDARNNKRKIRLDLLKYDIISNLKILSMSIHHMCSIVMKVFFLNPNGDRVLGRKESKVMAVIKRL